MQNATNIHNPKPSPLGGAGGGFTPGGSRRGPHLTIPITLTAYALTSKVVNQLKLYLYLKWVCSGHFKVEESTVEAACKYLDWKTPKTFHKNLLWLTQNKWVAYNSTSGSIRVKSFARLCNRLEIPTKTGVIFNESDFNTFRPFIYAAVITWSIRKRYWFNKRQPELKKGGSRKSMPDPKAKQTMQELPNRHLAKILELDHSTISRYRAAAAEAGYITLLHQYEDTELPPAYLAAFRHSMPEESDHYVIHNGTIQRQLPDRIHSTLHLKHRRPRAP